MAMTHAAAFRQSRPWRADEFAALLSLPGTFALGDSACFALVRVIADEAELLTIATHPDHRRQGRARTCMAAWMAEAARRGAAQAFLEVAHDNAAALALYEAMGFHRSGLRRGYYPRPGAVAADAVLMSCRLPSGQPAES
ncbi:GNAT family N-acetyltransferase [Antarcticimicrobium luteum]|uniref:GNAT family N-acetyltransferase n=2 Tax=Antarcticimicrobium luteum TaxID=2547397 RepID=A0A4R5UTQ8_9RHOB|nr:GNAT family N-acetyltransferase [Antarcticimicrobium luteum]